MAAIESGDVSPFDFEADELCGQTDGPEGCTVGPDGRCVHGYASAAITARLI